MIRRPPRSTQSRSSAASDVYKRQIDEHKLEFVIAAKSNKKIKAILEKHRKENGDTSTVFEYKFQEGGPTFNIVAMWDQKKGYILFATNKKMGLIDTFAVSYTHLTLPTIYS